MVQVEVITMTHRRLDAIAQQLRAMDPEALLGLVALSCLWIVWTVYVWMQNSFAR